METSDTGGPPPTPPHAGNTKALTDMADVFAAKPGWHLQTDANVRVQPIWPLVLKTC